MSKSPNAVSWYAPHLDESLSYIRRTGVDLAAAIVDVGGGEATLVDDLLEAGDLRVEARSPRLQRIQNMDRRADRQRR